MAGLLSTTLTGSMEAIHVAPVNDVHVTVVDNQEPINEKLPSHSKRGVDNTEKHPEQPTDTEHENDSSVINSSVDVSAKTAEHSTLSSDPRNKDTGKDSLVTNNSRTEKVQQMQNKNNSAPSTTTPKNDTDGVTKTKSMKRKRSNEENNAESKLAAKRGSSEQAAGEKEEEHTASAAASKGRATFFVKDWEFVQILGEGAYGEVKLAYNVKTREAVAVKIVDTSEKGVVWDDVRKEVCIHRMISHQNIIKFYGVRREGDIQYLFLEYASGGELFDRIEPDVGMPQAEAQKYFRQLIDGVEYLHSKGIAHRDIKPENLLLDENDDLKIADFGLATIFRYQDKWRYLERLCGSAPYLAPEVINNKPYRAEPADLWSCGIVFVAMLGGELPWDAAVLGCVEYVNWRECHIENRPWNKIDNLALCLLRRLLVDKPEKRYTIADIRKNQWFNKNFSKDRASQLSEGPLRKRGRSSESDHSPGYMSCSQPTISHVPNDPESLRTSKESSDESSDTSYTSAPISFSQPAQADDLLLSSQLNGTQSSSQTPMQKLVRRMTRFFSKQSRSEVLEELDRVFSLLGYSCKHCSSHVLTVHTTDRRQSLLIFKTMILEMGESLLIDFRLSKGDGLEFKRHFIRIREHMKSVICKVPPSWPNISYA